MNIRIERLSSIIRQSSPLAVLLVLAIVFLGKHLIPIESNFMGGIDIRDYHFWNIFFLREQVHAGSIPLWNPYAYCGHPYWANPANFILYPFMALYLVFPLPWAFNIDQELHIFIAGAGTYYLVRAITGSAGAGLVSAVIFSFSGHMIANVYAGHLTKIHSAALLPWIFFFVEKGIGSGRATHFILAGIVLGLQIFSGNTQNNLYTGYFLGLYFLARYFTMYRWISFGHFLKHGGHLFMVYVISLGVAAAFLVPAWEMIQLSDRTQETYEFATSTSYPPRLLFTFLVPNSKSIVLPEFWENYAYIGIFPIALIFLGIFFHRSRWLIITLVAMLIIALTFMLGSNSPLYMLYYKFLPLIAKVRAPTRALVVFVFFLAVISGTGVHYLLEKPDRKKVLVFSSAFLLITVLGLLVGAHLCHIPMNSNSMMQAFIFTMITFFTLFAVLYINNKHIALSLVIALIFINLYIIYHPLLPELNYDELLTRHYYEEVFEKDSDDYRVLIPISPTGDLRDMANRGIAFHHYNVGGYIPLVLRDFYQYIHAMAGLQVPQIERHTLNINLFRPDLAFTSKVLGIKYALVNTPEGLLMIRANWHMPRALLVKDAVVIPDYNNHLEYMRNPGFDPVKVVLLDETFNGDLKNRTTDMVKPTEKHYVDIVAYKPNRIDLKASSPSYSFLLLSELYYPGWQAYVDEWKVPIYRADYLLRAISLPPGEHSVTIVYRPLSLIIGVSISTSTITGIFLIWLWLRRKGYTRNGCLDPEATPERKSDEKGDALIGRTVVRRRRKGRQ